MRSILTFLFLTILSFPSFAQGPEPTCNAQIRELIARRLNAISNLSFQQQLQIQAQLYDQYYYCAEDGANIPTTDTIHVAAARCDSRLSFIGSVFFEEMPCCGYDPQRRMFTCPVRIKQSFGFGASPLPGSREHVMHCVLNPVNQYVPISFDSVHLSNSTFAPNWQFGTLADVNTLLHLMQPLNGIPKNVRSILSWGLIPTGCQYQPIWGNVIDYKVRLDL